MLKNGLSQLLVCALFYCACSDNDGTGRHVSGSIDGLVVIAAPVGGAIVTAYPYDRATGVRGSAIASSDPSDSSGAFHLPLGIYFGPILLVARGPGASYVEPTNGDTVPWDQALELRALYLARTAAGDLDPEFARGTAATNFVLSPFTEFAVDNALAQMSSRSMGFTDSVERSTILFHDHLELDFWATSPADLTTGGTRAWDPTVQFGLELAGLSELVARITADSGSGGFSSNVLVQYLLRDASYLQLDGQAQSGSLALGTCAGECKFSDQTLRSDWSDSMADFLASSRNQSTISYTGINDFLVRVATRESELFPNDVGQTYDVTPPTISVVASTVFDDLTKATVPLTGNTTATFSRYADNYGPMSFGIPDWRFLVTDDHTQDGSIAVQAQLEDSDDDSVLVPWFVVSYVNGSGYDEEVLVSSSLYSGILTSGNYQLEIQARDQKGNVSPSTLVKWQQTVLPAPAPTLAVVENIALDESSLVAEVTDQGPSYSGTATNVFLTTTATPSFSRYATRYRASDAGIPEWHFQVTDAYAMEQELGVTFTLTRDSDGSTVSSGSSPWVAASGYNHAVTVSADLNPDIAILSGAYTLTVSATNPGGTSASATVHFNQTILAPPLRQRGGSTCTDCANPVCPAHYTFASASENPSCGAGDNADQLLSGINLPTGGVLIADGIIDNPNPIPLRVALSETPYGMFNYAWELRLMPSPNFFWGPSQCNTNSILPDGSCYTPPTYNAQTIYPGFAQIDFKANFTTWFENGSALYACSTCATNEREIPANTSIEVKYYTHSFSWVAGSTVVAIPPFDTSPPFTGMVAQQWIFCGSKWQSGWCTIPAAYYEDVIWFQYMTATPHVPVTLTSRLADDRWSLGSATGTNVSQFEYASAMWSSTEDDWTPPDHSGDYGDPGSSPCAGGCNGP